MLQKCFIFTLRRSEFKTTETLLRAIASPANSGFKKSQIDKNAQAAIGIHKLL
jgi:hypothetical protein